MSEWSELPDDLLGGIVERIKKLEDFIVFFAVCKGWSKAKMKEYFKGLWLLQETPYLMLPVRNENDDIREFYSLVDGKIVESIRIPKFKDRKCLESLGWLLMIDKDGSMCLLNPFSSMEIPLPHQTTYPDYDFNNLNAYDFVQKMALSARPSETSDFIVMIIWGIESRLAFWKPGDELWNIIDMPEGVYMDIIYHGGKFYATCCSGCAWLITFEGRVVKSLIAENPLIDLYYEKKFYILRTSQSLFIISRDAFEFRDNSPLCDTKKFQVYEVDIFNDIWTEINNLGSMAIFIGHNTTFAIDSSRFSGKIKGNHIYFTDDCWKYYHFCERTDDGKDMGAYNMETRTIKTFYSEEWLINKVSPSIWITPSF